MELMYFGCFLKERQYLIKQAFELIIFYRTYYLFLKFSVER